MKSQHEKSIADVNDNDELVLYNRDPAHSMSYHHCCRCRGWPTGMKKWKRRLWRKKKVKLNKECRQFAFSVHHYYRYFSRKEVGVSETAFDWWCGKWRARLNQFLIMRYGAVVEIEAHGLLSLFHYYWAVHYYYYQHDKYQTLSIKLEFD